MVVTAEPHCWMRATQPRAALVSLSARESVLSTRLLAGVSFLAAFDDDHGGGMNRIALLVELESAARAVEFDRAQGVAKLRLVGRAGRLQRQHGRPHGVIGLGVNVVGI